MSLVQQKTKRTTSRKRTFYNDDDDDFEPDQELPKTNNPEQLNEEVKTCKRCQEEYIGSTKDHFRAQHPQQFQKTMERVKKKKMSDARSGNGKKCNGNEVIESSPEENVPGCTNRAVLSELQVEQAASDKSQEPIVELDEEACNCENCCKKPCGRCKPCSYKNLCIERKCLLKTPTCEECNIKFKTRKLLIAHKKNNCKPERKKLTRRKPQTLRYESVFLCGMSSHKKAYKSEEALNVHLGKKHVGEEIETRTGYKCKDCEHTTQTTNAIRKHVNSKHKC